MKKIALSTAVYNIANIKNRQEKIDVLRKVHWENKDIQYLLRLAFDPNVKWQLPPGEVPYKPSDEADTEAVLYTEMRRLAIFLEGNPQYQNLQQDRRQQLFIQLLEGLHPADAKMIMAIKDKQLPFKGLDADVVRDAWPGIF